MIFLDDIPCRLQFYRYWCAPHLSLYFADVATGEYVQWATVPHVPGGKLAVNEVLVKESPWLRNILKALEDAGVVSAAGRRIIYGGFAMPVAKLLVSPPAEMMVEARKQAVALAKRWGVRRVPL